MRVDHVDWSYATLSMAWRQKQNGCVRVHKRATEKKRKIFNKINKRKETIQLAFLVSIKGFEILQENRQQELNSFLIR